MTERFTPPDPARGSLGPTTRSRPASSLETDFLTIWRPTTDPATTTQFERTRYRPNGTWVYDAQFETIPDALEVTADEAPAPIAIEGKVAGTPFHVTAPRITTFGPCDSDDTVDVVFRPRSAGYERFGALENHGGSWMPIATTGIAMPGAVWRAGIDPECDVDHDLVARSRAANYWTPVTAEREDWSPRADILDLLSILPEDIPASTVADIAAATMNVDEGLVRDAVPGLRAKLRIGNAAGKRYYSRTERCGGTRPCGRPATGEVRMRNVERGDGVSVQLRCTAVRCARTEGLTLVDFAEHVLPRILCPCNRKAFLGVTT